MTIINKISRITFVTLDGIPPEEIGLEVLPPSKEVGEIIREAFSPFCTEDFDFLKLEDGAAKPKKSGLHLIYLYGHAWLTTCGPQVSIRDLLHSKIENGIDLLDRIIDVSSADRTIIIFDCCHAFAFDHNIVKSCIPRLIVYGCSEDEKAIALPGERASRLSLTISKTLSSHSKKIDLTNIFSEVAERLEGDGILRGQTVICRTNGLSIRINRGKQSKKRNRERTVALFRNILILTGALISCLLIVMGWYYRTHILIDVNFNGLEKIDHKVSLSVYEENPEFNVSELVVAQKAQSNHLRLWVPASNVIININATYPDGMPRAIVFHLNLISSFTISRKFVDITLPPIDEIISHPNMAFVPVTPWLHGEELELTTNRAPFWIDIKPPTVSEYATIANALYGSNKLAQENSFYISWKNSSQNSNNLDATPNKIVKLDITYDSNILSDNDSEGLQSDDIRDFVIGVSNIPCENCPARMTRYEADLYCKHRKMRLPTGLEWELAARGVDGRLYPWGNKFDKTRANVPGLPEKEEGSSSLKPVNFYPNERSPFGLIDTVGNAGDWVMDESDKKYVFMGGTYRRSPIDATVFSSLPLEENDYIGHEITARCVDELSHH